MLLAVGGWLGGTLSYRHQIGVDPEESRVPELGPPSATPLEHHHA